MPSRSSHRAALQRSKEPSVIAPVGVMLPALPVGMNWHNPVAGETVDRDQWEILRVGPAGASVLARVRRNQAGEADVYLPIPGSASVPEPVTYPTAQAFEVAAEFARSSSR
jgi:hypothetical protein